MSRFWRLAAWATGLAAVLFAGPAAAQGDLNAGKSPAQIFSDTCAACHRSPGQVRRASASFLRSHYTTGSDEASVMARYLAGVPSEPRTPRSQQKKEAARPKETPSETARRGEPKEQAKEQAKGQADSSKGHSARTAEAKSSAPPSAAETPEIKQEEPAAQPTPPAAPPPPALEPFEE